MNPSCLKFALTEEERKTFNETGYLIVENVLSPEQVAMLPIRRQLLGAGVNCNGYYNPTDADVPLHTWLKEHQREMV